MTLSRSRHPSREYRLTGHSGQISQCLGQPVLVMKERSLPVGDTNRCAKLAATAQQILIAFNLYSNILSFATGMGNTGVTGLPRA